MITNNIKGPLVKKFDFEILAWLDNPCCLLSKTLRFIEFLILFHGFTAVLLKIPEAGKASCLKILLLAPCELFLGFP